MGLSEERAKSSSPTGQLSCQGRPSRIDSRMLSNRVPWLANQAILTWSGIDSSSHLGAMHYLYHHLAQFQYRLPTRRNRAGRDGRSTGWPFLDGIRRRRGSEPLCRPRLPSELVRRRDSTEGDQTGFVRDRQVSTPNQRPSAFVPS